MSEIYLSVTIPTYNEEKRLTGTLQSINDYLSRQSYDYEILVVDNGSTDKTAQIVRSLAGQIKGLKLIEGLGSQGKGFAVKKGMLMAKGDFRIFIDADNSTSIDQIEKMWPEFKKGYDVVIGSRDVEGAVLDPPQPWIRDKILGKGFKLYRKIILGLWGIQDTQCGFKCFTKKATEEIFPRCKINHFAFDPEVLVVGKSLGYKIKEIPVYWKNDPESKVNFKSIIKMAIDLIKIRLNLIKGVYA
ncbi:MAG: glycosyltransferase family 2 protein [bacterium]|nr:glycosyltransferase family 2 protein [bacterium]